MAGEVTYRRPLYQMGDRGAEVKAVQQALVRAGYSVGKSGADGIFGTDTFNAVKAFQAANKLPVDGIVWLETFNALSVAPPAPSQVSTPKPNLTVSVADPRNPVVVATPTGIPTWVIVAGAGVLGLGAWYLFGRKSSPSSAPAVAGYHRRRRRKR